MRSINLFVIITMFPVPLLLLSAVFGGYWTLTAILYFTVIPALLDRVIAVRIPAVDDAQTKKLSERLSSSLAAAHFLLLIGAVAALAHNPMLGFLDMFGVILAFALYFAFVSGANAQLLVLGRDRKKRALGEWIFISLGFGHRASALRYVHRLFAGSAHDPNSAAMGEGFWSFLPSAWFDSFVAGYEMESQIAERLHRSSARIYNPFMMYIAGAVGFLVLMMLIGGFTGALSYVMLCVMSNALILLIDYVQHYKLERRILPKGGIERLMRQHSWNAPQWFSSLLLLNTTLQSDHHAHPMKPFAALSYDDRADPSLPYPLPVMLIIALFPRLWRSVMDHRATALRPDTEEETPPLGLVGLST